ncbi:MAG: isoprenylcysteine carboxylmethyltransferase family protein [Pyrinomonadaceae bacterium]|nr:isoprenylcysteine carboxylmethyltransferase family protein [Pyrinomonadaceae bacterium]
MNINTSASIYYLLQGFGVLLWWGLLFVWPESRELFRMGSDDTVLLSFWLPDIVFLAFGSIAAGVLSFVEHQYKAIVAWFVTGLVTYATMYTFSYALMNDSGWLGVVFMAPATLWSGVFAIGVSSIGDRMFRKSAEASTGWILFKTFSQIVVVWSLILVVFPYLIVWAERRIGISQFEFPFQIPVSVVLFVLASIPGVWSAIVMSKFGEGTPLPMDHASNFVVEGPYAYVRNPMAVSGIGQGITVALMWGSPLVLIYALMGSLIWQLIFRPLEEEDLEKRFGDEFVHYRDSVRCWIPRFRKYLTAEDAKTAE